MTDPAPSDMFDLLRAQLRAIKPARAVGQVSALGRDYITIVGLDRVAALGDRVRIGPDIAGEVLGIKEGAVKVMPEGAAEGLRLGAEVVHLGPASISPHMSWLGRVIDPDGQPMDGAPCFPARKPIRLWRRRRLRPFGGVWGNA